jgi:hypothetical protein
MNEQEDAQEPMPLLITLDEAARMLAVSPKWLRVNRKHLPFVRELAPRLLRADVTALRRWVERRRG